MASAAVLVGSLTVLFISAAAPPGGRDVIGSVVGGVQVRKGSDRLTVAIRDRDGGDARVSVRVHQLLPDGTPVHVRIAPDGTARLAGSDEKHNASSGAEDLAWTLAVMALLSVVGALLGLAAERRERRRARGTRKTARLRKRR